MISTTWAKASYSNSFSNCVEARWAKSSHSIANGQCTEIRSDGGAVQMRDSKDKAGPVLDFTRAEWTEFLGTIKSGALDLA